MGINGVQTDPVTFILYIHAQRYEKLEEERAALAGAKLYNFSVKPGETMDVALVRFDMIRDDAESAGAGIYNFITLSHIIIKAFRLLAAP